MIYFILLFTKGITIDVVFIAMPFTAEGVQIPNFWGYLILKYCESRKSGSRHSAAGVSCTCSIDKQCQWNVGDSRIRADQTTVLAVP